MHTFQTHTSRLLYTSCMWVTFIHLWCYNFSADNRQSSHPSTNQAQPCLASKMRWDQVHSGRYGYQQDKFYFHFWNNSQAVNFLASTSTNKYRVFFKEKCHIYCGIYFMYLFMPYLFYVFLKLLAVKKKKSVIFIRFLL